MDTGFNNRVDGAGFFTKTAIDAFEQVDIVTGRSPGTVFANIGFDGNCQSRAYCLAKLAGDTPFLAVRVAPECMQAPKTWRLRRFFFGVLNRYLFGEKILQSNPGPLKQFPQRKGPDDLASFARLPRSMGQALE